MNHSVRIDVEAPRTRHHPPALHCESDRSGAINHVCLPLFLLSEIQQSLSIFKALSSVIGSLHHTARRNVVAYQLSFVLANFNGSQSPP